MTNAEIIENNYQQAVLGIKEEWFQNATDDWFYHISTLPLPLKYTYCILIMHNQVFNGGFDQYFVNGYGQFAKMAIEGLRAIGAPKKADLVKQALELVNQENFDDVTFRHKLLKKDLSILFTGDKLSNLLEVLDDKYYALEDEEDIEQLLGDYLRR